jgi:hypothetical protein
LTFTKFDRASKKATSQSSLRESVVPTAVPRLHIAPSTMDALKGLYSRYACHPSPPLSAKFTGAQHVRAGAEIDVFIRF